MMTVIVHIANEDAVQCEIEELPKSTDNTVLVHNPRKRDGKDLHYLDEEVTMVIYPLWRINFIQILPTAGAEEVIGFVRER